MLNYEIWTEYRLTISYFRDVLTNKNILQPEN